MIRQGNNGPPGPRLKICGLTRAGDVSHCVARGVHFVGFNLFPGSKRHVSALTARQLWLAAVAEVLARGDAVRTQPVAVVVDPGADDLARALVEFPELAAVQFHGGETPEALERMRARLGGRAAWKALGVGADKDVREAPRRFAGVCELILLDNARVPAGAAVMGGSGQAFDWRWIPEYDAGVPLGIAGGVRPTNAAQLLAFPAISLIDVSSGIESAPGEKDRGLIDALCRIVTL